MLEMLAGVGQEHPHIYQQYKACKGYDSKRQFAFKLALCPDGSTFDAMGGG